MATRKTATKPAIKPVAAASKPSRDEAFANWQDANKKLFDAFDVPSHRRAITSMVVGCIVGGGLSYAGGQVVTLVVTGALVLTGSAFLALLLYVIGLCLTVYGAFMAGCTVQNWVLTKSADKWFAGAKTKCSDAMDRVRGFTFGGAQHA